jgi:hypothetical protein
VGCAGLRPVRRSGTVPAMSRILPSLPLRALPLGAALLLANACGPGAGAPPPVTPVALTSTSASAEAAPVAPTSVVAGDMPADAQVYAEITAVPAILALVRGATGAGALASLHAEIAKEMGVDVPLAERLVATVASVHVGGRMDGSDFGVAVSLVFSDAQPIRDALAAGALVDADAYGARGRRLRVKGEAREPKDQRLVWFEGSKLLVAGSESIVKGVSAVVEGRAPALSEAQRGAVASGDGPRASGFVAPALLNLLAEGKVSFPAPLTLAYTPWEGGVRGAYRVAIAAAGGKANLPVPPPQALALAKRLPAETAAYVALSTKVPGDAAQAVAALEAIQGRDVLVLDTVLFNQAGVHLADLLGSLGAEGVMGGVLRPGVTKEADLEKSSAFVLLLQVADPGPLQAVLEMARDKLSADKKVKVHVEGAGFSADLPKDGAAPFVRVKLDGGLLFVGAGPRDLVDRAASAAATGKGTLGDDAAHARAVSALPAASEVRLWLDVGRLVEIAAATAPPAERASLDFLRTLSRGPGRTTSALAFTAVPESDRLRLEVDEVNVVGALSALGVYGVRQYIRSAKTAEARNTIGAIARAAVTAYEREGFDPKNPSAPPLHRLCTTAPPVPKEVPRAKKYQATSEPGKDFDRGDLDHGWNCLKFRMEAPFYYRYSYTAGGPYKGPARGGPDPGPNGFEVAAEGDLDGNGVTSLFTQVGQVKNGVLVLSPKIFADKENE